MGKKDILSLFSIDIRMIPDESFYDDRTETNSCGTIVRHYTKNLSHKELGIFDSVEVLVFDGSNDMNVCFMCDQPDHVEFDKIISLIRLLFDFYGKDLFSKGDYVEKDKFEYYDKVFNVIFGRWYTNINPQIWLRRDDLSVKLILHGVGRAT